MTAAFTMLLFATASPAATGSDDDAIRALLMKSFDRPDARLAVDPVVVANDHAMADWIQGDRGGRALLKRKAGQWMIVLCSGDGIKTADAMRKAGVSAADAPDLAARLENAEKSMSPERRALLASFDGTVMMGTDDGHSASAHGNGQSQHSGDRVSHEQMGNKK